MGEKLNLLPRSSDGQLLFLVNMLSKMKDEISFTKYFYQFKPLRSLEEIAADLLALESSTEGVLRHIVH